MKRKTTLFSLMLCVAFAFGQEKAVWNKVQNAQQNGIQFQEMELFTWKAEIPQDQRHIVDEGAILSVNQKVVENIISEKPDAISFKLPIGQSQVLTITLLQNSDLLTDDFSVVTSSSGGEEVNVALGAYYQGVIAAEQNSWAALSVFNDEVVGVFYSPVYGEINLGVIENSTSGDHIVYTSRSWKVPMIFECGNESNNDLILPEPAQTEVANPDNCVRIYFECEYNMYQDNGSSVQNTVNYLTGIYNVVKTLYDNESINTTVSQIFVWDTPDPFATGPSTSDALVSFRNYRTSYNGDLAHLVSRGAPSGGGVAWVNGLCSSYGYAYSYIYSTYSQFPTYSWTTNVITHEMGHNLGSRHTHDCVWDVDGNGTASEAIDGCGPAAGYSSGCNASLPSNGGTIMSYCHLISSVGINLSNGFGPLPGNLIRNNVYNATCLSSCATSGGGCTNPIASFPYSESFESGLGAWSNTGGDDTDWLRLSGSTPSTGTGPTSANDGSFYAYIESSSPNYPSKTANLISACFDFSGLSNPTIDFSYHMYGAAMGTLNVQVSTNNGTSWSTVWTLSGDQGNSWFTQSVSLSALAGEPQVNIRFNGITGTSWTSDICIDNVSIQDGSSADTQPPTAPLNLAASNTTTTSTDLTWTASTDNVGVTGYTVYVDGILNGTTAVTSYTVTGLTPATTYNIYVTASDAAGNMSAASNTVTVTTLSNGGGSNVLLGSYFETGWDGWADGGGDCARYAGSRSWEGTYSIQLRDNSGVASAMTSPVLDLTGYSQIEVEFYFYANSMENNEDFWLRYYNGSSWTTVAAWAAGSSFNNNTFYVATVTLNNTGYTFPSNAQIRFQCDASANNDLIYIDAVTVTATSSSMANSPSAPVASIKEVGSGRSSNVQSVIEGSVLYPNPAAGIINIETEDQPEQVHVLNLAGQIVMQISDTDNLSAIDVSHLPAGSYVVALRFGDEIEYIRFIKQ